jgi:lysophospholipase L1-like esterase
MKIFSSLWLLWVGSIAFAAEVQPPAATPAPDLTTNPAPVIAPLNPALPTLFVAGDSTATNSSGYGVPFATFFDPAKVNVANRARGGTSSRTFITNGAWDKLLSELKKDDIVLIQFGTNDGGAINDEPPPPLRARGTLPGLGEETREIDNVLTKQHEVVHTYGWYIRKMIADVKAKGANPIVMSLTARNIWNEGKIERTRPYGHWAYEVAKAANVPFIDVGNMVADRLEQLGAEQVKPMYPKDHTHFAGAGAELHASTIVAGLKGLRPSPVKGLLSPAGEAVEADHLVWLRLPTPADPKLPTLFLVGDSTVRNGKGDGSDGQWGWGEPIADLFDPAKINVVNRAVGGLSSRTYITAGHWDRVLAMMKPGDFVIMQLGTNDGAALNDTSRARGTIKGNGEETAEIDNLLTKKHEVVHSYGWYLRKIISDTKAKGATPIVCSLVPRKTWKDGKIVREDYAKWAAEAAKQGGAAFLPLNELVARKYEELGPEKVDPLFADPHTHTSRAGAEVNAALVVEGLRALPDAPLTRFLR